MQVRMPTRGVALVLLMEMKYDYSAGSATGKEGCSRRAPGKAQRHAREAISIERAPPSCRIHSALGDSGQPMFMLH